MDVPLKDKNGKLAILTYVAGILMIWLLFCQSPFWMHLRFFRCDNQLAYLFTNCFSWQIDNDLFMKCFDWCVNTGIHLLKQYLYFSCFLLFGGNSKTFFETTFHSLWNKVKYFLKFFKVQNNVINNNFFNS